MRHAEILTLLCANPEGLTSEQLSDGVYGDSAAGRLDPGRDLAAAQAAGRLHRDRALPAARRRCSSDVAQVCGLLHRGQVREAAARYGGPMLPGSKAPGVVREREALEGWVRQSVMSAGDAEALWAWVQGPTRARRTCSAWQRLLVNLPFQDPRRPLAASRLARLRADAEQPAGL